MREKLHQALKLQELKNASQVREIHLRATRDILGKISLIQNS